MAKRKAKINLRKSVKFAAKKAGGRGQGEN
jgi:hypothetical protein